MNRMGFSRDERRLICLISQQADQQPTGTPVEVDVPAGYEEAAAGLIDGGVLTSDPDRPLGRRRNALVVLTPGQRRALPALVAESRVQITGALILERVYASPDRGSAVDPVDKLVDEETGPITEEEAFDALEELKHLEMIKGLPVGYPQDLARPTLTSVGRSAARSGMGPGDFAHTTARPVHQGGTMSHYETNINGPVGAANIGEHGSIGDIGNINQNTNTEPTREDITELVDAIRAALAEVEDLDAGVKKQVTEDLADIETRNAERGHNWREWIRHRAQTIAMVLEMSVNTATVIPLAGQLAQLMG